MNFQFCGHSFTMRFTYSQLITKGGLDTDIPARSGPTMYCLQAAHFLDKTDGTVQQDRLFVCNDCL